MRFIRATRIVPALLLATTAIGGARPAVAQQLFREMKTGVDLSTYTNIYDCMAAVDRVARTKRDEAFFATGVWPDTLPFDREETWRPLPAEIGATARECLDAVAAREDLSSIPTSAWRIQANLYLHAGMADSARAVVERRIAEIADDAEELRELFTEIQFLYSGKDVLNRTGIQPPLLEVADEIVLSHVGKMPTLDGRLHVYMQMLVTGGEDASKANERGDRARKLLARMRAQLDSLEQEHADGLVNRGLVHDDLRLTPAKARERLEGMAALFIGRGFLLDELRVSTKAYSDAMRGVFSKATGNPPEAYPWPLGQPAPRIEAEAWAGCEEEPCEAYPRKGRVSVIAFHVPEANQRHTMGERPYPGLLHPFDGGSCAERAITLRHLEDQFPGIDIVVVSRSLGYYHYVKEGITPQREADLLYQCFKSHGLRRVVVAVTKTPGWRLPEPDGRLASRPTTNWTGYSFGGVWTDADRFQHGSDLIVDQDGYVLNAFSRRVARWSLEAFGEIIQVLLDREKAGKA